jgi:mRNA interferase MazF
MGKDIWSIDLNPTRYQEQSGNRYALVLSENTFNLGPAGLVVIIPINIKRKRHSSQRKLLIEAL